MTKPIVLGWWALNAVVVAPGLAGALSAQTSAPAAEALLDGLEGTWRFELFPAGADRPTLQGERSFEEFLPDRPALMWTESFDDRDVIVRGVLGFDAARDRFYELGVATDGSVDHWIGTFTEDRRGIAWSDPSDDDTPERGVLRVVSPNEFVFQSTAFRAVFARVR